MMMHSFVIFIAFTVAFTVPIIEAADGYSAEVSQAFYKEYERCLLKIVVQGKGIYEKYSDACEENGIKYFASEKVVLIGDPEINSFSIFSNTPNSVIEVHKDQCRRRTKSFIYSLDTNDCESILNQIKEVLKNNANEIKEAAMPPNPETEEKVDPLKEEGSVIVPHVITPPTKQGDESEKVDFLKDAGTIIGPHEFTPPTKEGDESDAVHPVKPPASDDGGKGDQGLTDSSGVEKPIYKLDSKVHISTNCVHKIHVKGHGINEHLKESCLTVGLKGIATNTVLIYGNPRYNSFVLYSDEPSTLNIIKDGLCKQHKYTTEGGKTKSTPTDVVGEACNQLKQKIMARVKVENKNINLSGQNNISSDILTNPGRLLNILRQLLKSVVKNSKKN